jgi:hypothetical protein
METFALIVAVMASILFLVGLYKPWILLWWKETQNRRTIFKVYGTIALCSILLYSLFRLIVK